MDEIRIDRVTEMGMSLDRWVYKSCEAHFGTGIDWATLYDIRSTEPSQGHATALLTAAKKHYESQGKRFGGSVALNKRMAGIYKALDITEYKEV